MLHVHIGCATQSYKYLYILQRITMAQVLEDPWFKEGYKPENNKVEEDVNVDDVYMVFNDSKVWETQMGSG